MARVSVVLLAAAALLLPGAAQAETTLTIRVVSVSTSLREVDKGPKGVSAGDRVIFSDTLRNAVRQFGKPKGAKVGSDRGVMRFTSSRTARFEGSARLPGGTLRLEGDVIPVSRESIAIPVTGGTGRYAGARGVVIVGPGTKRALNTYQLRLPGTTA
jgi:hypothetical protein